MTNETHPSRPRPRPRRRDLSWLYCLAGAIALVALVGWAGRKPWEMMVRERAHLQRLQQENAELDRSNRELAAKKRRLETPGGVEAEARHQGWVKPGETIVNLDGQPSKR